MQDTQNTIALADWIGTIEKEYLSTYVRKGGSAVKFAVTPDGLKQALYPDMESRCKALDFEVVKLDAKDGKMRAYMPAGHILRAGETVGLAAAGTQQDSGHRG